MKIWIRGETSKNMLAWKFKTDSNSVVRGQIHEEISSHRHIITECFATLLAVEHAIRLKQDEVIIKHHHKSIEKILSGKHKMKNIHIEYYVKQFKEMSKKIDVIFEQE